MLRRTGMRILIYVGLLGLIPPLVTACSPPVVAQSDQDKVKQSSEEPGVMVVLGVKKAPPPAPPLPSATPPPKRTTPASYYEAVGPFFFYVETLTSTGPSDYGIMPTVPCTQSGVFKRGMRMVVRFEVLDTSTGKRVTDKDGATIKLVLPHGAEIPARWAIRGGAAAMPDSHWMWDTSWDIPPDYPLGSFDYRLVVTAKDGRTATFTPPIQKTKTADSRVRIID